MATAKRPKLGVSHGVVAGGRSHDAPRPKKRGARAPLGKKGKPQPAPRTAERRTEAFAPRLRRENKGPRPEIRSTPSEEAKAIALSIATAALDKKAVDVQIVDVAGRVDYADFLVLMSGRSDRHVMAIADGIEDELRKGIDGGGGRAAVAPRRPSAVEGRSGGNWIVLDFDDVVAHVFQEEARSFYDLDSLWQDARRVPVAGARG